MADQLREACLALLAEVHVGDGKIVCPEALSPHIRNIYEALNFRQELGATGEFPEGTLDQSDNGELNMAVTDDGVHVVLQFGTPVAWLAFQPSQAREFAAVLLEHAARLERTVDGTKTN